MNQCDSHLATRSVCDKETSVVAIIVTYNRLKNLKASVRAYREELVNNILVIDNGSTDGTHAWLEAVRVHEPRLRVLSLGRNSGGAGGFAAGLRWADRILQGRGWIVLHDDDAYPVPGVTTKFRQHLAYGLYESCAAVATAVITPEGSPADINRPILNFFSHPLECWQRVRGKGTMLRDLYHVPGKDLLDQQTCYRVHAASFVGLYLNLERLPCSERERYPESDLFIYGDDTLYTANLTRRSLQILFDARLRYVHNTGTGYEKGILRPEWKHYYISRNSLRVYLMLASWLGPLLYLMALTRRLQIILKIQQSELRNRSARAYWLGLVDALRGQRFRKHEEVVHYVEKGACGLAPVSWTGR